METFVNIFGLMLIISLITLVLVLTFVPNKSEKYEPEYKIYKHNIKSVDYSNNISGYFALGSGHISSYDYYYIYIINEDNSISLNKYDTDYTKIYEDVEKIEDSYIEIKEYSSFIYQNEYSLHIPKGYILYQLNLQGDNND